MRYPDTVFAVVSVVVVVIVIDIHRHVIQQTRMAEQETEVVVVPRGMASELSPGHTGEIVSGEERVVGELRGGTDRGRYASPYDRGDQWLRQTLQTQPRRHVASAV